MWTPAVVLFPPLTLNVELSITSALECPLYVIPVEPDPFTSKVEPETIVSLTVSFKIPLLFVPVIIKWEPPRTFVNVEPVVA